MIHQMLFLTSEKANKAEIAILSARDTTRAWVPGRGIMHRRSQGGPGVPVTPPL